MADGQAEGAGRIVILRHAPALTEGRLCGRTDVPADFGNRMRLAALRRTLGRPARLVTSPALRCRQTAAALWPDLVPEENPALWEQDFGAWEGRAHACIPDLGRLAPEDLARHRPPGGESFADLCARVAPSLSALAGEGGATVVAHAGVVRAALALAMGRVAPALSFAVAPLGVSVICGGPSGGWRIESVNAQPAQAPAPPGGTR